MAQLIDIEKLDAHLGGDVRYLNGFDSMAELFTPNTCSKVLPGKRLKTIGALRLPSTS
jgi:hypothetical protein